MSAVRAEDKYHGTVPSTDQYYIWNTSSENIHPEDLHGFYHINFVFMCFTMSPHKCK